MGDAQLMAGSQQTLLLCPYIALRLASDIFLYRVSPAPGVAGHRIHGIVKIASLCREMMSFSARPSAGGNGYCSLVAVIDTCLLNSDSASRRLT